MADNDRIPTDGPGPSGPEQRLWIEQPEPGGLVLTGEIDGANADDLYAALESASGAPTLLVDLCGVTYLDSVGVGALFDVAHANMRLRVTDGSAVATVITICGLNQIAQVEFVPR